MSVRQLDKRPDGAQDSPYDQEDLDAAEAHVTCLVQVPYLLLHDGNVLADVLDIRLQHSNVLFPVRHVTFPSNILILTLIRHASIRYQNQASN